MLEKCKYCGHRERQKYMQRHEKTCIKRKRFLKREYNQTVTQTLEYRLELLKSFPEIDLNSYDFEKMSDIHFNDLIHRFTVLKNELLKAKEENALKELQEKEKNEKLKLEQDEKFRIELEKEEQAEKDRLLQIEREKERTKKILDNKESTEKFYEDKRKVQVEIKESPIEILEKQIENTLADLPKKELTEKKVKPKRKRKVK